MFDVASYFVALDTGKRCTRCDSIVPDAAMRTARHAMALRAVGVGGRKRKIPKQHYPHSLEMEYGKVLIRHLGKAHSALVPLMDELPGLLTRAQAERGDRMDAGEPARVRELLQKARDQLEQTMRPPEIESVARLFGTRTQTFQRVQLGRQVRAALGVDVFASDKRIGTLLDHFVHENAVLIKSIPVDLIGQVEKLTSQAFTTGKLHADLADEINQRFDVGESRARLIARDQLGKLYGQTNADRQQDLGIESFIWRTAGDERVREEHEILEGQQFTYDDPPDEGLPGEPICCRCSAEPVFATILDAATSTETDES